MSSSSARAHALHTVMNPAIDEGLPQTTLLEDTAAKYSLRTKLAALTDTEIERLQKAGDVWFENCFLHTMLLNPVGARPLGHYAILHDNVLGFRTRVLVMQRSDMEFVVGHARSNPLHESLDIFLGLLLEYGGAEAALSWFTATFYPVIQAVDKAYLACRAFTPNNMMDGGPGMVIRYKHALSILAPATADPVVNVEDSATSAPAKNLHASAKHSHADNMAYTEPESGTTQVGAKGSNIKLEELVKPLDTSPPILKNMVGSFARYIRRESKVLMKTAFPGGVLALAAEAPQAFATGFMSVFAPPKGIKRKNADSDTDSRDDEDSDDPQTPRRRRRRISYVRDVSLSPPTAHDRSSFMASPARNYYRSGPAPPHRRRPSRVVSVAVAVDAIEGRNHPGTTYYTILPPCISTVVTAVKNSVTILDADLEFAITLGSFILIL
ncbi:hypothetical protein B0H16DRAFT_1692554 [Mycena metata]|uniref:Uncharacterized protein n=1 Tax=Mycena metata TaxID=1033252 RepID=A0AAD7N556_9AGAR|nr:hypothetical protein B0H16DRAFT_1692554 [Mycena metata]